MLHHFKPFSCGADGARMSENAPASSTYFIRDGYEHRPEPDYFVDIEADTGLICQPDVYVDAAMVAATLGARTIVDIGCGNGYKLAELHPDFEVIGIDLPGPNLDACRERYPFGTWLEHDLDTTDPLPLTREQLEGAVVVASDVVEHLKRPELLLKKLRWALDVADAVFLSTPERELTWGTAHAGPPPNPHHVREWSLREFAAFLESEGFDHGEVGLTRNNNQHNQMNNIFATVLREEAHVEVIARVLRMSQLQRRALAA
jgi:SAM-dependent methyltransferase